MVVAFLLLLQLTSSVTLEENPSFAAGRRLYDDMNDERALERFQAAARDPRLGAADRALVLVWVALTHAELGRFDSAKASFDSALRLHIDVQLPPRTSPRIATLFAQQRKSAIAAAEKTALAAEVARAALPATAYATADRAPAPATLDVNGTPSLPVTPWLLAGSGAAAGLAVTAFIVGGVFGGQAASQQQMAETAKFQSDVFKHASDASTQAFWANTMYGAGAVLLASGAAIAGVGFVGEVQP